MLFAAYLFVPEVMNSLIHHLYALRIFSNAAIPALAYCQAISD